MDHWPVSAVAAARVGSALALLALLIWSIKSHNSFLQLYYGRLTAISRLAVSDSEKISALVKAPAWVPTWRLSLVASSALTLVFAAAGLLGCDQHLDMPAAWILTFLLLFLCSYLSQNYRTAHMEMHPRELVLRVLHPNQVASSFWKEVG